MPENTRGTGINTTKATEIFISLLVSPLFGFSLAIILMFILRRALDKPLRNLVFSEPKKNQPPPNWIRGILIATCTLVSFFHGSNDGQKGVGMIMLILIGITPTYFALDSSKDPLMMQDNLTKIETVVNRVDSSLLSARDRTELTETKREIAMLQSKLSKPLVDNALPEDDRLNARRSLLLINRNIKDLIDSDTANLRTVSAVLPTMLLTGLS
jgi:PiT family inorganic phosphate transporter